MANNYDELFANPPQGATQPQAVQQVQPPPSNSGNNYDALFASEPSKPSVPKQSSFMDAVDAFNAKVTNLAAGELQLFAKGLGMVGVDTSNFQKKLGVVNNTYQSLGEEARKNSPKAALAGDILGDITNISEVAAQTATGVGALAGAGALLTGGGAAGAASAASSAAIPVLAPLLGTGSLVTRLGGSAALSGAEGLAEYGSTEERLNRGAQQGLLGAMGQGAAESLGYLAKESKPILQSLAPKGALNTADNVVGQEASLINKMQNPTVGMVTGKEGIQNLESAMAEVPFFGTKGAMKKAAKDITNIANDTLSDIGVGKKSMQELGDALVSNVEDTFSKAKSTVQEKYNLATDFATKNNIDVPLENSQKIAQSILKEKGSLSKEGFSAAEVGEEANLLKNFAENGKISAENFEGLRRLLNDRISSFSRGPDPQGMKKAFSQLKQSMDVDLQNVGEKIGGEYGNLLKDARTSYQELVAPFKETKALDKVTGEMVVNSDEVLNQAISNKSPIKTAQIMKQLSPEAQKDFSAAIVQKVAEGAKDIEGNIDMHKLATGIKNLGETVNALPGDTKNLVQGLQKFIAKGDYILKAAKGGGKEFAAVRGAANLGIYGGAAGGALGYISMPALMAGASGAKALSKMLTSPRIAKQLIRLGGKGLNETTTNNTIRYILKQIIPISPAPADVGRYKDKNKAS
jgi:hypothetical protein